MSKPDRQCTAKAKSTGKRCEQSAIRGGTVCWKHGGAAPQVKAAAERRLATLVDPAINALAKILAGDAQTASDLIRAAQIVLDRTGHGPSSKLEIADKVRSEELGRVLRALQEAGVTPEQISAARAIIEQEDAGSDAAVH